MNNIGTREEDHVPIKTDKNLDLFCFNNSSKLAVLRLSVLCMDLQLQLLFISKIYIFNSLNKYPEYYVVFAFFVI